MKKVTMWMMVIMMMVSIANATAATVYQNTNVTFGDKGYNITDDMMEFAEDGVDLSFVVKGIPDNEEQLVRVFVRYCVNIAMNNNEAFYTVYDEYGHVIDEHYGRIADNVVIWDKEDISGDFVMNQIIDIIEEAENEGGFEVEVWRENVEELLAE